MLRVINLLMYVCMYVCMYVYVCVYMAKIPEENYGALGVSAKGQGRLTESSGSSNDV